MTDQIIEAKLTNKKLYSKFHLKKLGESSGQNLREKKRQGYFWKKNAIQWYWITLTRFCTVVSKEIINQKKNKQPTLLCQYLKCIMTLISWAAKFHLYTFTPD